MMIQQPQERPSPVPDHLRIEVVRDGPLASVTMDSLREALENPEAAGWVKPHLLSRLHHVSQQLQKGFDPARSRALLFSRTRKDTARHAEVLRQFLAKGGARLAVGIFHAGLPSEERLEIYEQFLKGELQVLVSTKAFGMGMDIPNIHFLAHLDLPTTLEDYLQEIGRAGRDRRLLREAGYSTEQPISCWLYYSQDEVNRARGFHRRGRLHWRDLQTVLSALLDFSRRIHGRLHKGRLVIPLSARALLPSSKLDDTKLRVALHWLERLQRIKLGCFFPPFLSFRLGPRRLSGDSPLARLQQVVRQSAQTRGHVQVNSNDLIRAAGSGELGELFRLIQEGERQDCFALLNEAMVTLSLEHDEAERVWCAEHASLPFSACVPFTLALSLNRQVESQDLILERDELRLRLRQAAQDQAEEVDWSWLRGLPAEAQARRKQSWRERQMRLIPQQVGPLLRLLRHRGGLRVESTFDAERGVQIALSRHLGGLTKALPELEDLCRRVMPDLLGMKRTGQAKILSNWLTELRCTLPDLESALGYLAACGLTGGEPLLDRSIELDLLDTRPIEPGGASTGEAADQVVANDFEEQLRLGEYRLASLDLAAHLDPAEQRSFFHEFFECASADELLDCLQRRLLDPALQQRWEAQGLADEMAKLLHAAQGHLVEATLTELGNAEQRQAITHPPGGAVLISAGPGSGKTHILSLRCAWLLLEKECRPQDLLVLAYNRAVVLEIRHRLAALFLKLGIRGEAERVPVHTLHGYAGLVLGPPARFAEPEIFQRLLEEAQARRPEWLSHWEGQGWVRRDGKGWRPAAKLLVERPDPDQARKTICGVKPPVELWIPWAAWELERQPARLVAKEILLDEMQDLTRPRLELLQVLAKGARGSLFAVGDPDQSIYGHERAALGESPAPEPLIEALEQSLAAMDKPPTSLTLATNYRCSSTVLAEAWQRRGRRGSAPQKARHKGGDVHVLPGDPHDPAQVLGSLYPLLGTTKSKGEPLARIGVLFRTNAELGLTLAALERDTRFQNLSSQMGSLEILTDQAYAHFEHAREWLHVRALLADLPEVTDAMGVAECISRDRKAQRNRQAGWDQRALRTGRRLARGLARSLGDPIRREDLLLAADELAAQPDGLLQALQLWPSDPDEEKAPVQEVLLGTIHRAKGLQYDAVVLAPSAMNLGTSPDELEEERRVAYVACTRAARRLIVIEGPREQALAAGTAFASSRRLPPVLASLEDVDLSGLVRRGVHADAEDLAAHQRLLHDRLPHGQALVLQGKSLLAEIDGRRLEVGQVSRAYREQLSDYLAGFGQPADTPCTGLRVAAVIRRELTRESLEFRPDAEVQRRGFHWLVVPAGVPQPVPSQSLTPRPA
jgi:ATP-dependent DNA helicase RecQ